MTNAEQAIEIDRLRTALQQERTTNAALRAKILRIQHAKIRLHGHCKFCEYVPADLKPFTEPATERLHNGG